MPSGLHSLRSVYVDTMVRLARADERIVMLDADSKEATKTDVFARKFPERSFSLGIAEQNMVTVAGGMASCGLKPYVNSYSMFIAMRALDQVRNSVAYPNLDVTFVVSHHGLDVGADGVTHQLIEDIAIMRAIPCMAVLVPADSAEMEQMVVYTAAHRGPVYLKSGKTPVPDVHRRGYRWQLGVPSVIADGERVALVACGVMVQKALRARDALIKGGVAWPRVVNMSTIKPLKIGALVETVRGCDVVVACEDHSIYGGLGGLVAEVMSAHRPVTVSRIGVKDVFAECGAPDELFKKYGMDECAIFERVVSLMRRTKRKRQYGQR